MSSLTGTVHRRITGSGLAGLMRRRIARVPAPRPGFAGFRFAPEVFSAR